MTESSGYMDPGSYDAATFAAAQARIIKRGYQQGYLNSLAVSQNTPTAMNVLVATGGAWVEGSWYINDAIKTMTIDAADSTLDRIDLIVIRRSATTSVALAVLKGSLSGSPVAPTLTKTLTTYEMPIAQISIVHGTTAITTAMITDTRTSSDCGPVGCEMGFFSLDTSGNLAAGSKRITGLSDPSAAQDAETKSHVAALLAALANPDPTGHPLLEVRVNAAGNGYELVERPYFVVATASDTLQKSSDVDAYTVSQSFVLLKSIYIPPHHLKGGTYRVKFDYESENGGSCSIVITNNSATSDLVRLGSIVGFTNSTYTTYSGDITLAGGDGFNLWAICNTSGQVAHIKNFRIYCTETEAAPVW